MWHWFSEEMLNLIEWMKEYNTNFNSKLEFKGIDIQYICDDYNIKDAINDYIKKINKKYKLIQEKTKGLSDIEQGESINYRDKCMFKVFMKIYNPNKKYFIFAHNSHLQRHPDSELMFKFVGNYIYKKFKNNYYVIAGAFYFGKWLGYDYSNFDFKTLDGIPKKAIGYIKLKDLPKIGIKDNEIFRRMFKYR